MWDTFRKPSEIGAWKQTTDSGDKWYKLVADYLRALHMSQIVLFTKFHYELQ